MALIYFSWVVVFILGVVLTWSAVGLLFWPGVPTPPNWPALRMGGYAVVLLIPCLILVSVPMLFSDQEDKSG